MPKDDDFHRASRCVSPGVEVEPVPNHAGAVAVTRQIDEPASDRTDRQGGPTTKRLAITPGGCGVTVSSKQSDSYATTVPQLWLMS